MVKVQLATIPYDAEVKHDGRLHKFHIPSLHINKCAACDEITFGNVTDDEISQALREHLNLLSPRQIRDGLVMLGLKQKEFGAQIGVAAETISRWLSGTHIQSRAMDNLMRLFFEFDSVRSKLTAAQALKGLDGACFVVPPTPAMQTDMVTLGPYVESYVLSTEPPNLQAVCRPPNKFPTKGVLFTDSVDLLPVPQWNNQGLPGNCSLEAGAEIKMSAAETNLTTAV
jgi:DNA-binding transcriptional regulator YiaG